MCIRQYWGGLYFISATGESRESWALIKFITVFVKRPQKKLP